MKINLDEAEIDFLFNCVRDYNLLGNPKKYELGAKLYAALSKIKHS